MRLRPPRSCQGPGSGGGSGPARKPQQGLAVVPERRADPVDDPAHSAAVISPRRRTDYSPVPRPLARAPGERGEVAVDLARGIVPVDPEGVHVAPGGLGEGEAARGRVTDIVEVD